MLALLRALAAPSPPRVFYYGAAVIAGLTLVAWVVAWVVAGPRVVALLDRVTTAPAGAPAALTSFAFEQGDGVAEREPVLTVGDRRWGAEPAWRLVERPAGRVTLETPAGGVVLGVLTRRWSLGRERRSYEFVPEPGDVVSFTRRRSRVPWPRPLDIAWLGGHPPRWGRYVYHRLEWRKPSGAVLEVVWRDEQRWRAGDGWTDEYQPWPPVATRLQGGDVGRAHRPPADARR